MSAFKNPAAAAIFAIAAVLSTPSRAADWPQLQGNAAHTGYSDDEPKPPYRVLWFRDLEEPTQSAAQPIVAGDKLFVSTGCGNLIALARGDGRTLWTYETAAPIFATPAWAEGVVYVNSLDGCCHAVRDADGTARWTFPTAAPIWAAPVVAEDRVFVAGRDGFVYALDAKSGAELWRAAVPSLVMCTPAWSDGTLYVGVGDMRIYALDGATGRQVWQSEKLGGSAIREYWIVAAHGTVIATVEHPVSFRLQWREIQQAVINPFIEAHKNDPVLVEDEVFMMLAERFRQNPEEQSCFVLDARSGRQKFIVPLVLVEGGGCTPIPPAVDPEGWAYFVYANIRLSASGNAFFGRLSLDDGRVEPLLKDRFAGAAQWTGYPGHLPRPGVEWPSGKGDFFGGFAVIDQSWAVSVGGQIAFPVRDPSWHFSAPFHNWHHIVSGEGGFLTGDIMGQRAISGTGLYGSGYHSTCSPVAIAGKGLFHKSPRSVIFAFEGN